MSLRKYAHTTDASLISYTEHFRKVSNDKLRSRRKKQIKRNHQQNNSYSHIINNMRQTYPIHRKSKCMLYYIFLAFSVRSVGRFRFVCLQTSNALNYFPFCFVPFFYFKFGFVSVSHLATNLFWLIGIYIML